MVRSRYASLPKVEVVPEPVPSGPDNDEEDDDYEPSFEPAEDDEQIQNRMDIDEPEKEQNPAPEDNPLPFQLQQAPPLTEEQLMNCSKATVSRLIELMTSLPDHDNSSTQKAGFNRVAGGNLNNKRAWVTILARMATRPTAGLDQVADEVKKEDDPDGATDRFVMADYIRERLYTYIIEDFRKRIDTAVTWLTEEWYSESVLKREMEDAPAHYEKWALKVLDGMLPYLDAKDKLFTRFLSEMPMLNQAIIERVKSLARDPERVTLAVSTLQ